MTDGLQNDVASQRLRENGSNSVFPPKHTPDYQLFFLALVSGFAPLLWVSAALCLISWKVLTYGPKPDYFLILAIIFLAAIFGTSAYTFTQVRDQVKLLAHRHSQNYCLYCVPTVFSNAEQLEYCITSGD